MKNKYDNEIIKMISDSAWASLSIAVPYIGTIMEKILTGKKIRKIEKEIILLSARVDKLIEERNPSLRSTEVYNGIMKIAASTPTKNIPNDMLSDLLKYLITFDCNLQEKEEIARYINNLDFKCLNETKRIVDNFINILIDSKKNSPNGLNIEFKIDGYGNKKIYASYNKNIISKSQVDEFMSKYDITDEFLEDKWKDAIKLRLMRPSHSTYFGVLTTNTYAHPNLIFIFFISYFNNVENKS